MRPGLLAVVLVVLTFGSVQAQGTIPEGAGARDSQGVGWVVTGGSQVGVAIHPEYSRQDEVTGSQGEDPSDPPPVQVTGSEVTIRSDRAGKLPRVPIELTAGDHEVEYQIVANLMGQTYCEGGGQIILMPWVDGRPGNSEDRRTVMIRPRAQRRSKDEPGLDFFFDVKAGTYIVMSTPGCDFEWVKLRPM